MFGCTFDALQKAGKDQAFNWIILNSIYGKTNMDR